MKTCRTCARSLSLDRFHRDRNRADGLVTACKDCASAASRQWYAGNRERHREWVKQDRAKKPEAYRSRARKAQAARRAKLKVGRRNLFAGDPCSYCGGVADTQDHIWPISKLGADHSSNLTPACTACNQEKGDAHLLQFLLGRQRRALAAA